MTKNTPSPYENKAHDAASAVVWHNQTVTPALRAKRKNQKPACIWLTGLSASGKSTIANALEANLTANGFHTMLLDGDNVRHGLCKDLSMSAKDRTENIRRVAEMAKILTEAGLIVVTAFISPFIKDRQIARELFLENEFIEVFIDTPLSVCQQRDPKGLYKKALEGSIKDFTGISSPYEAPTNPNVTVDCSSMKLEESLEHLMNALSPKIQHA